MMTRSGNSWLEDKLYALVRDNIPKGRLQGREWGRPLSSAQDLRVSTLLGMDDFLSATGQGRDFLSLQMELALSSLKTLPQVEGGEEIAPCNECEMFMHSVSHGIAMCVSAAGKGLHIVGTRKRKRNEAPVVQTAEQEGTGSDDSDSGDNEEEDD